MFEYLFGDELLVAPIIDEGATSRPVYLPDGLWYDIASGAAFEGPTVIEASAAPGEIPVFAPAGAIVPRLPRGVETLVPTDDPDVVDVGDVAGEMVLDVFLGADGTFELPDGTTIELISEASAVGEGPVTASVDGDELDETSLPDGIAGVTVVATPNGRDVEVTITTDEATSTLSVTGAPRDRSYTLRIRR